jgi:hypothetical protein
MRSIEDRVRTLEDEVMRQQAIILSMSQSLRALTGAPEASQGVEEAQEEAEPRPSTGGAEQETPRPPAPSAPTSRLGMSGRAVAVGGIATFLSWFLGVPTVLFYVTGVEEVGIPVPGIFRSATGTLTGGLVLPMLVPLLSGMWAGSTKRPSLSWFSSPHRWLRRGGRSVLEIAMFAAGIPAWLAFVIVSDVFVGAGLVLTIFFVCAVASLAFMSGAFLGNALRRVGLLGTPKELPQGEEEGEHEEEVWTPRKEARWGLAGSIIVALISAVASVVAAALSQ